MPSVITLGHFSFARQRVRSQGDVLTIGTAHNPKRIILKSVCQNASKLLFVKNDRPPIISPQIAIATVIFHVLLKRPNAE